MEQLLMIWRKETGTEKHYKTLSNVRIPEGLEIRPIEHTEREMTEWVEIMREGIYPPDADIGVYERDMINHDGYTREDVICGYFGGRMAGSVSGFKLENGEGYIHMVGTLKEYRGRGISTALLSVAMERLIAKGCSVITLTTDDFRIPAIKSYFREGFTASKHSPEMEKRWADIENVLKINK